MEIRKEYKIGLMLVLSFVCYMLICPLNMDLYHTWLFYLLISLFVVGVIIMLHALLKAENNCKG